MTNVLSRLSLGVAALGFALAAAPPAQAQELWTLFNTGRATQQVSQRQLGPACIRLCPEDDNPCDPVYFKTADGRCNGYLRGGIRGGRR